MGRINLFDKIKKFFIYFLGFDKPGAIVINLSLILIFLAVIPANVVSKGPPICVFKNIILPFVFHGNCPTSGLFVDCNCPACGLTRAISSIMHGDFSAAWGYNRLSFLVFGLMVFLIIFNLIKAIKEHKLRNAKRKTGRKRKLNQSK